MVDELKNEKLPDGSMPAEGAQPAVETAASETPSFRAIVAEEPVEEAAAVDVAVDEAPTAEVPVAEVNSEQPTELVDPVGAQNAETTVIPPTDPASLVQPTAEMPTAFEQPQPTTRMEVPQAPAQDAFDAQPQSVYQAQVPASDYAPSAASTTGEAGYTEPVSQAAPVDAGYQQAAPTNQSPYFAPPVPPTPAYQNAVRTPVAPDISYQPVAPLAALTGGMKFGWLVVGLMLGIPGMLIAWLANNDKHPQVKKDAIMWSVIGFAIQVIVGILLTILFVAMMAAAYSSTGYYGGPYY